MVKNVSGNVEFYCMNKHAEPVLLRERERSDDGKDNFFACPKYMRKDEKHPDGHEEDEKGCLNRLSFSDAGDILGKFNKIVEEDLLAGSITDYEGYTFEHHGITITVLERSGNKIKFGIYNKKAIEKK